MEIRSHQNKTGPSWNVSKIIDTVFHDEHTEEINNLQEEDCGIDDDGIRIALMVNNSLHELCDTNTFLFWALQALLMHVHMLTCVNAASDCKLSLDLDAF